MNNFALTTLGLLLLFLWPIVVNAQIQAFGTSCNQIIGHAQLPQKSAQLRFGPSFNRMTNHEKSRLANESLTYCLEKEILPNVWKIQDRKQSAQNKITFDHLAIGTYRIALLKGTEKTPIAISNSILVDKVCTNPPALPTTLGQFFPNPTKDLINYQFSDEVTLPIKAQLLRPNGQLVQTIRLDSSNGQLPHGSLPSGLYFIRLKDAVGQVFQHRLIVLQ